MGFYYTTYLYKGRIADAEPADDLSSMRVGDSYIVYEPTALIQLATIDPIIDDDDKSRGFVPMEMLTGAVRVSGDGWSICEIEYSTLMGTGRITVNLPVRAAAE